MTRSTIALQCQLVRIKSMNESISTHRVVFQPSGRQGRIAEGTSLLDAARQLGVDIDSICGGRQTCGKCKILIETGAFAKHAIESSPAHVTPVEAAERAYFARH